MACASSVQAWGQGARDQTFADRSTEELVGRARARHVHQDSLVRDYRAQITTRMDAAAGRSRFARMLPLLAHETAGRITWRRPNDMRLEILGIRNKSIFPGAEADVTHDRPWFVPRALGDSIRLMGVPETAALHPLAPGAESVYRYAIVDSVIVSWLGRTIRVINVRVEPKTSGPSLVAGDVWLDAGTADVVRLTVAFIGEYLWDVPKAGATAKDSADVRKGNRWASRIVSVQADLEYSLLENRYWMPYRQLLAITIELDIIVRGAMPIRAITTFHDYEINVDPVLAFNVELVDSVNSREVARCEALVQVRVSGDGPTCPEGMGREQRRKEYGYDRGGRWENGRWEVTVPARDSLMAYQWREPLKLDLDEADAERIRQAIANLAHVTEDLPDELTGRRRYGIAFDRLADVMRFNRVQGASFGLGYGFLPGPAFTSVRLNARFGTADRRFAGSVDWRRESPAGAWDIRGFRQVAEVEPWTRGQSLGNSLNAVFAGHDDADYYLATGGGMTYYPYTGFLHDVELGLWFERHRSMRTRTTSGINDAFGGSGVFQPNPAVAEGDYVRALIAPRVHVGRSSFTAGAEALLGETAQGGRAWAAAKIPFGLAGYTGALSLKAGHGAGDPLPQLLFRVGGPHTVRGYDYGVNTDRGFWAAQLDIGLRPSAAWAPVVFADVGKGFDATKPFSLQQPLVGIGAGVSLLNGWVRANVAKGLNPATSLRFDLQFGAPR
ncbi:MAG TPA: hypothetical protein VGA37_03240 [Gemmatimonadales bacterium]